MEDYKYKLQYIDGNDTVIHEFNAGINSYDLTIRLRDFLCGSGWTEEQVKNILKLEEGEE